jgi:glutaminase
MHGNRDVVSKQVAASRNWHDWVILAAGVLALGMSASTPARGPKAARDADYVLAVNQAHKRYAGNPAGKVTNDVPVLAAVSPSLFAVVVARVDGKIFEAGDASTRFALTGLAAPFAAALVAEQRGPEALSGTLAAAAGLTPLPNARGASDWGASPTTALKPRGAIATLALLEPKGDADAKWRALQLNLSKFANAPVSVDDAIYRSAKTDPRQIEATARDLAGDGGLADDVTVTTDLYLRQGSVTVTARELAVMAATLANDGVNPSSRDAAVRPAVAQGIVQLISQAGIRGGKSSALNKAMLIATSGSSGAILVVVPGRLGIGVYAPPLDSSGVSVRGQQALRYLDQALMLDGDPSKP